MGTAQGKEIIFQGEISPVGRPVFVWVYNRIMKLSNLFKLIVAVAAAELAGVVDCSFWILDI